MHSKQWGIRKVQADEFLSIKDEIMANFSQINQLQNKKFKGMNALSSIKKNAEINVLLEDLYKKTEAQCNSLQGILRNQLKKGQKVPKKPSKLVIVFCCCFEWASCVSKLNRKKSMRRKKQKSKPK